MRKILGFILFLHALCLPAQQVVLKPVNDSLATYSTQEAKIVNGIYKQLSGMKRVRFLGEDKPDNPGATHTLVVRPTYTGGEWVFGALKFTDSTKTVNVPFSLELSASAQISCYDLETGRVLGVKTVKKNYSGSQNYSISYPEAGYTPGQRPKNYAEFEQKVKDLVRKKYATDLKFNFGDKEDYAINDVIGQTDDVLYSFFPYRLDLLAVTEGNEKKAKAVRISGGSSYDLRKGTRLCVFKVEEMNANGRKFERLLPLGRLKFEEDDAQGGIAKVQKGEKDIAEALSAGTKLYCNPGYSPRPIKVEEPGIRVAIAAFEAPGYSQAQRENMFRRLEGELYELSNMTLVDRQSRGYTEAEKEFQKSADMIDKTSIDQYKMQGADLILAVKVGPMDTKMQSDNSGGAGNTRHSVRAFFSATLKLIDVETAEVLQEKTQPSAFVRPISDPARYAAEETRARQQACSEAQFFLSAFMKEVFPPVITIAEITEAGKDKAEEVLLIGDVSDEPYKRYKVYKQRVIEVDGKKLIRLEELGEVASRVSEGEGIMPAKVKDGGKEIFAAFNAGAPLMCSDKPGFFERSLGKSVNLASKFYPNLKD